MLVCTVALSSSWIPPKLSNCGRIGVFAFHHRSIRPTMMAAMDGASWAEATGVPGMGVAIPYFELFSRLAASSEFVEDFGRAPKLFSQPCEGIAGSFTLKDLEQAVDSDFLDAGRGVSGKGGWKMAPVSQPRGSSFEEAKMRYCDVAASLSGGTVVFNSAGAYIPKLGAFCLAALDAFQLPNCLNLYCTGVGTVTSAPPHTDKQDVFVLQSCGRKHWRVYEPPAPALRPQSDPLARGKGNDELAFSELGEPVIDTVLTPGQVLFVPAGWPHTTDTVNTAAVADGEEAATANEDSVHLTIGIDTHIWGLDRWSMRSATLQRARLDDHLVPTTLPAEVYWKLMQTPPHVGFLARHQSEGGVAAAAKQCAEDILAAEPARWEEVSKVELKLAADLAAVTEKIGAHAQLLTQIQRAMYTDAALDRRPSGPGMPAVSLFRVKGHMDVLERAMEAHVNWLGPAAVAAATQAAKGVAQQPAATKGGMGSAQGTEAKKRGMGLRPTSKKGSGGKKTKSKK